MQPDSRYPLLKYSAVVVGRRCAYRTSLENDRGRVPTNPCCQMNRVIARKVPGDRCSPDHAQRVWKATLSRCWWERCDAPLSRAGFLENGPVEASGLRDRQSA